MRMGGLFHKRQNSLFCVSHLILSNAPKAIRPHAHCLKDAQFMRPPLPRRRRRLLFKPRAKPRCCSAPARSLKKKNKPREGKWDLNLGDTRAQESGPASALVRVFVCLSRAAISALNCRRPFGLLCLPPGRPTRTPNKQEAASFSPSGPWAISGRHRS